VQSVTFRAATRQRARKDHTRSNPRPDDRELPAPARAWWHRRHEYCTGPGMSTVLRSDPGARGAGSLAPLDRLLLASRPFMSHLRAPRARPVARRGLRPRAHRLRVAGCVAGARCCRAMSERAPLAGGRHRLRARAVPAGRTQSLAVFESPRPAGDRGRGPAAARRRRACAGSPSRLILAFSALPRLLLDIEAVPQNDVVSAPWSGCCLARLPVEREGVCCGGDNQMLVARRLLGLNSLYTTSPSACSLPTHAAQGPLAARTRCCCCRGADRRGGEHRAVLCLCS